MVANENLGAAKKAKFDEFYTQYHDIEKEMNAYLDFNKDVFRDKTILLPCDDPEWSNFTKYFAQNFERLGLKKLISTSYAPDSKPQELNLQMTLFETASPKFDKAKARANGKIYTLTRDATGDKKINVEDLEWEYLKGDGDFRSPEVSALRDEADIVITNPPFSLFRDFLEWIVIADKKMVILGNMNAITYREVFRLIKDNKLWLGESIHSGDREFEVPQSVDTHSPSLRIDENGKRLIRVDGIRWFTNLDHGKRHQPLTLMTEEDNIKFSKHKVIKGFGYKKYDNYDAIDVSFTDGIPSDYEGTMGVPISFLSKYNPDQFEIVWQASGNTRASAPAEILETLKYRPHKDDRGGCGVIDGARLYSRILIRHKR
jgi:hypothetical protein